MCHNPLCQALSNPMVQQMMASNPQMAQQAQMLQQNPQLLEQMMSNPMVQQVGAELPFLPPLLLSDDE